MKTDGYFLVTRTTATPDSAATALADWLLREVSRATEAQP